MLKKIAFVTYPVKDVQRAREFYEGKLGLTLGLHGHHGDKWWVEYDLPGGGCLALSNFQGEPSASAGGTIAFEVEDLDALMSQLKASGVTFKSDVIPARAAAWRCAWTPRATRCCCTSWTRTSARRLSASYRNHIRTKMTKPTLRSAGSTLTSHSGCGRPSTFARSACNSSSTSCGRMENPATWRTRHRK